MKLKLLTITSLFLLNTAWTQAQTTTSLPASAGSQGAYNSSFGDQAGNAGNNNSVFGYKAGDLVSGTGEYNSFFGANTGVFNTIGKDNVFVGYKSGYTNTSGEKNVFIGRESGYANNGGSMNVFSGYESGHNNIDGFRNTFAGAQSGYSNTSGSYNVFSGYKSGFNNRNGSNNIFSGYYAGYLNTSGSSNIFSGWQAGNNNTSGNFNTCIGYRAGYNNNTGSYNIFIGRNAGCKETGSNRLYIDNGELSSENIPLIYGRFDTDQLGINTTDIPTGYTMAVKGKLMTDGLKVKGDIITENGNVGIGIAIPDSKLTVAGAIHTSFPGSTDPINAMTIDVNSFVTPSNSLASSFFRVRDIGADYYTPFIIRGDGNVGIGTVTPNEKLTVKGKIHAEEIIVTATVTPDYVFQKYYTGKSELKSDYTMPTLDEVAQFTKINNHLPNIPSAKEIQQTGVSLGEMNNLLLQKVEELTLYAIEQQKKLNEQNKTMDIQSKMLEVLAVRLSNLEKK